MSHESLSPSQTPRSTPNSSPNKKRSRSSSIIAIQELKQNYTDFFKEFSCFASEWAKVIRSGLPAHQILVEQINMLYDLSLGMPDFSHFIAESEGIQALDAEREMVKRWVSTVSLELQHLVKLHGQQTITEKLFEQPHLLQWIAPFFDPHCETPLMDGLKKLKVEQENRALVIASIKKNYKDNVVAILHSVQKNLQRYSYNAEIFFAKWNSTSNLIVEKIEVFSGYCFVLRDILHAINTLKKCHETAIQCSDAINDKNETKVMDETADGIKRMFESLEREVDSTCKEASKLRHLYGLEKENLDEELHAFIKPWLHSADSTAILASTSAIETHQANESVNHEEYVRSNRVLIGTQPRSRI